MPLSVSHKSKYGGGAGACENKFLVSICTVERNNEYIPVICANYVQWNMKQTCRPSDNGNDTNMCSDTYVRPFVYEY